MNKIKIFIELTRLNKPIGFMLLFWPCLWGLTLAFNQAKEFEVFVKLLIFILYDLDKIKNNLNNCLILKNTTKVKNLNYIKCIETIEKNYEELNKNVNPSIGLFSMIIEMKKILNPEIINE